MDLNVVLLSQHPQLLEETADLLNSEWKRSSSARLQSLEKSSIHLPDSLLLVETNENRSIVIGHSRLTKVLEDPNGCWIGSVVISKEKRKKGYGKYLMQKTEEYAKTFQFTTAYLNTRDQQGFYEHLGYTYCTPVSSISFDWNGSIPKSIFSNRKDCESTNILNSIKNQNYVKTSHQETNQKQNAPSSSPPPPPLPPPPPPPPSTKVTSVNNTWSNLGQYWMKKKL